MDVYMYVCMYGWMDGWMDGWMGGKMDGWMDGWMDQRPLVMDTLGPYIGPIAIAHPMWMHPMYW